MAACGRFKMRCAVIVPLCTLVAGVSPVLAQEAPAAGDGRPAAAQLPASSEIGEIVVTAQKRAQKLSDVGITIAAANTAQLRASGVTSVADLPKIASGFTTATTFAGYSVFSLRGVNFNASQLSAPPAVSTYIDEAALPYPPMTGGLLFDVERVEVLKGPQGTLFGQNATGGSVNVIAAKPTNDLSAGISTEVNNFGQVMIEGFASGPLSDTLRARFAGTTTQGGAWQKGYFLNDQKNGDQNKFAGRLLLEWTPSDRVKISTNFNASRDRGESQQLQLHRLLPNAAFNPLFANGYPMPTRARDADFQLGLDTHKRDRQYQGVVRADIELSDNLTLTSLTNYIDFKTNQPRDYDGTALDSSKGFSSGRIKSFIQEVRLTGKIPDAGIVYIIGGNYEKDKIDDNLLIEFPSYSGLPAGSVLDSRYKTTNRAAGIFGNVDYEFVPGLTLTGGVRYTKTRQTVQGCEFGNAQVAGTLGFLANVARAASGQAPTAAYLPGECNTINDVPATPGGVPTFLPVFADLVQNQDNISWRAGLNFKPDPDSLLYATVSRGYKAGAFPIHNILFQSQIRQLGQEELTSYEIGAKVALFDRAVRINVAGFYYDYKDKQFYTYVPVPIIGNSSTLVNIPKSSAKGIDADMTVNPVSGLTLRGGLTYVASKVGTYSGFSSDGTLVNFTGKEFNFAPPLTATFDAEYRFPVAAAVQAYVGFGGLYNSRTFSDLGENPLDRLPAHTVLDARVGVESADGWRVGLWIRNLNNAYYWSNTTLGGDTAGRYAGMPRTFGLSAGYRF